MPWMHIYIDNDAFGADTYEELMDRLGKVLESQKGRGVKKNSRIIG